LGCGKNRGERKTKKEEIGKIREKGGTPTWTWGAEVSNAAFREMQNP